MLAATLLLIATTAGAGDIVFVSPQQGGQAIGVLPIEITTTIANVDRVDFYIDATLAGAARKAPFRIAHDFGTSLAAHTITAKVYANGYRDTTSQSITTAALTAGEVYNVDFVEVPLRIRASRLLRAADLRVRENGADQTIRELRQNRAAANFVFVIDRSLSMGDGKLEAVLRATQRESSIQLRDDDRAQMVLFNHIVSRPQAIAIPAGVAPSGGTSLRDAVSSIATDDRTYVIVITDGGDRNSLITEQAALEKISRTKTVVHAIVLGSASPFLERAAANTGGTVTRADARSIQRALHDVLADINSRYTLAYQSSGHANGWRAIDVQSRRRDVTIMNARKGYFSR